MKKWCAFLTLAAVALVLAACVRDWQGRPTGATGTAPAPDATLAEPGATPFTLTPAQPTLTSAPPTSTSAAPTFTSIPPTFTSVPPTLTSAPPTPTSAPPTFTPSPAPAGYRLQFPPGATTLTVAGSARPSAPGLYVLRASSQQILDVQVSLPMAQATLAIWGADGTRLKDAADGRLWWRGSLPSTQDYYLEVASTGGERRFSLAVRIPVRISFAAGSTSVQVDESLEPAMPDFFVLRASAGQTMEVVLNSSSPGTMMELSALDGSFLLGPGDTSRAWSGVLPATQDYFLYLYNSTGAATYRLGINIPAGTGTLPVRISFPVGGTTATLSGTLPAAGQAAYVLGARAGQILDVQVDSASGGILLDIWGADGGVLKHGAVGGAGWRGYLPSTQDYYLSLTSESSAVGYTLGVSIPARISFAGGATSATVTGRVQGYESILYVLGASAGQVMQVDLTAADPEVLPSIWGFDGEVLKRYVDGAQSWSGILPATQDYFLLVSSFGGGADYSLKVTIP